MHEELPFDPCPFISDPHQQTILSSFLNWGTDPHAVQKIISLPDGDKLSLEVTTPSTWKEGDLTVAMVHGLCGSHQSPYLIRLVKKLEAIGIRAVRINMRGCGSGRGLSRQIYHSGRSEDIFHAIKALKMEHPSSPMLLIGFSLGGNIVLKMAGELHTLANQFLQQVISVSPPVDLLSSVELLSDSSNAIYEKYFYRLLRNELLYLHRKFKELPRLHLPRNLTLRQFDEMYTAPRCGFKDALDYYSKCSSIHVINEITVPCRILLSEDDPIVCSKSLDAHALPENVRLYKTKKGGHMGYLGNPMDEKGFHWLDSVLMEWILCQKQW